MSSESTQVKNSWHIPFPRCPFNDSLIQWIIRMGITVIGTLGLYLVNIWVSVLYLAYSLSYHFLIMPIKHCKYCYYNTQSQTLNLNGKAVVELLPVNSWTEGYLDKHVSCGHKWGAPHLAILWFTPIILLAIVLFLNFTVYPLTLLGIFIALLAVMGLHMKSKVCETCTIKEACHSSF